MSNVKCTLPTGRDLRRISRFFFNIFCLFDIQSFSKRYTWGKRAKIHTESKKLNKKKL